MVAVITSISPAGHGIFKPISTTSHDPVQNSRLRGLRGMAKPLKKSAPQGSHPASSMRCDSSSIRLLANLQATADRSIVTKKSVYDRVRVDSDVERHFREKLESMGPVKCLLPLDARGIFV